MRTLSATLTAAQQSTSYIPLYKVVLSRTNQTTQTYTKTRILSIEHTDGQGAEIVLDNSDNALTDIDFEHYQAVISYGIITSAGEEYSATAPMRIRKQELSSQPGALTCKLTAISARYQLREDPARTDCILEADDTRTVKTLITAIADATLTGVKAVELFTNYTAYTVTYDSEDDIINAFKPADYFRFPLNANRADKIEELLNYTNCKMREEDDGELHIIVPRMSGLTWAAGTDYAVNAYVQPSSPNNSFTYQCTTAGTSQTGTEPTWPTTDGGTVTDGTVIWTARGFHYEYQLATAAQHTFFGKAIRKRFVNPNGESILGTGANCVAASQPSYTYAQKVHTTEIRQTLTGNDALNEAIRIGKAIILRYELQSEASAVNVPMNVGQELWDYVKVTDSRESGDLTIGNVQYLKRTVKISKKEGLTFTMQMALGKVSGPLELPADGFAETQALVPLAAVQTVSKTIVWTIKGTLAVGTNVSFEIPIPVDLTCINVWINVKDAPTGAALTVDVNIGGVTIFGTQANRPSIAAGATNDVSGAPSVTALHAGQILSVDIDEVGSAFAGADLVVSVRCIEKVQK